MKKFRHENKVPQDKRNEREVMNMNRYTLLEPNNVIPEWEGGGEEKKEVSNTLRGLRQKYDTICLTVEKKEQELAELNKQLVKAAEEEMFITESNSTMSGQSSQQQTDLDDLRQEH